MEGRQVRRFILALDPGKKTGLASYDRETDTFRSGEADFDETCNYLMQPAAMFHPDVMHEVNHGTLDIVSESFLITVNTAKNTQATWSLELIGVARMVSHLYGRQPLVLQAPAAAKRLMSDDMLKTLDWYKPGKGHANDAARHLGMFMLGRKWMDDRIIQYVASH